MIRRVSKKIAFVSSYLPRKCGIATFTSDLINNMALAGDMEFEPLVLAMDAGGKTAYDKPVGFTIRKDAKCDYSSAADRINFSDVEVVSVQHEFGLYGGAGGWYISLLLEQLNKPVITTLHTILDSPSAEYYRSLKNVCAASEKIIVMNERGTQMLRDIYEIPEHKIELIPHGIPDIPLADSGHYKRRLGIEGRRTILTFGLLGRNKGIEVMLKALPTIVKTDPSVLYMVVGATHPGVLRHEGQAYRTELEAMVADLGLRDNVVFHNRFVDDDELSDFLGAADIYVTPYLHKEQLTSGTLSFAVGTGRAVVSTPYWAAQELLAQGRGRLVRFGDPEHIASSIVEIINDRKLFSSMKERAYEYGRSRTWEKVGQAYWELFADQACSVPVTARSHCKMWNLPGAVCSRNPAYLSA